MDLITYAMLNKKIGNIAPTISITDIEGGHRVTVTTSEGSKHFDILNGTNGINGVDGTDGIDGYSPAVTISEIEGGHRLTITDQDHPSGQTFDILDGETPSLEGYATEAYVNSQIGAAIEGGY